MIPSLLEFIPNQPFAFRDFPNTEEDCDCIDGGYCLKYQPGDPIKIQFRQRWGQSDTKPNIICSPTFQDFVGADLVTNGDFPTDASSWTLTPGGGGGTMAWNAGVVSLTPGNSTPNITQTIASLVIGKTYRIRFTISDYVAGGAYAGVGNDVSTVQHVGNGVFDSVVTYTVGATELIIRFFIDSELSIDDISIVELGTCWNYGGNNISLSDDGITKVAGSAVTIQNTGTGLNVNPYGMLFNGLYAFRVKIKDRTEGTFKIKIGASSSQLIDENGEFTIFMTISANPSHVEYILDADFTGTVESIYCYPLYSIYSGDGFVFHMTDLQDNFMGDVTPFVNYLNDRVIIFASMDVINFGLIEYGCYKIKVADPLPNPTNYENRLPQGDFNDDSYWTVPGGMSVNDISIESRIGRLFISVNGTISTNVTLDDGKLYYLFLNRITNTAAYTVTIKYGGVTLASYGILAGDPSNAGHGFVVSAPVGDLLEITFSGLTSNTLFESAQIFLDSYYHDAFAFESNCISYQELHPCTMVLDAYTPGYHGGFHFPATLQPYPIDDYIPGLFSLWQRLAVMSFNPAYPSGQEIAIQSDGNDDTTHASRKKFKVMHFDRVDEVMHDCISAMRLCTHFFIYPGANVGSPSTPLYSSQFRYVSKREDYVPDNDRDGRRKLTQSRIEVALRKNNIFFTKEL